MPSVKMNKTEPAVSATKSLPQGNGLIHVTDELGRTIGVRKLTALQKHRLRRLAGSQDAMNFPVMLDIFSAASTAEIDEEPEDIPISMRGVEGIIEQLGDEGLEVVGKIVLTHLGITKEEIDAAKK